MEESLLPDGVLGLHTEQEGGCKVHKVVNTHNMVRLLRIKVKVTSIIILILSIINLSLTMLPGNEVPNNPK